MGARLINNPRRTKIGHVEAFPVLHMRSLRKSAMFSEGQRTEGHFLYPGASNAITIIVDLRSEHDLKVLLKVGHADSATNMQVIGLTHRPTGFNGRRWYFVSKNGKRAETYRALTDLIPDPRNARTHPKRQIDQLRASIEAFGFTNPILVDPEGHIIAGHGRLQAARAMGLTELPVITLSGLSEIQKRTLRVADNKIALNAGWDLEILKLELGELASIDVDIDLTLTGFSTGEIDVVLTSADDPDDEVIPAVPLTPRTKLGDLWILGDHRVGCGDGRDAEFLRRVIGHGALVDAAFLDPPYNVPIGGHAVSAGRHR